jgi:ubiquinone/menaquinone biosynthesis C-methylase UbiE
MACRFARANPIVAVDVNPYLLREAATLTQGAGLAAAIEFRAGNAEALPFPDGSFDVAYAFTVLEEGDADRMLAALARVVRPGGRVGVLSVAEAVEWRAAADQAMADGAYLWAEPYHCAVGTKPMSDPGTMLAEQLRQPDEPDIAPA